MGVAARFLSFAPHIDDAKLYCTLLAFYNFDTASILDSDGSETKNLGNFVILSQICDFSAFELKLVKR